MPKPSWRKVRDLNATLTLGAGQLCAVARA
jgi:hypothetical protein